MASSIRFDFRNRRGELLAGRLEMPATPPKAYAIFAHCFTCTKNNKAVSRISRALSARKIAVLRFDFTGLGNSEGDFGNTNFSSNVEDLVVAADSLREHYEAPQLLIGHSLGGVAALFAATEIAEARAVSTIGAPSSPGHVVQLLGETVAEVRRRGLAQLRLAGQTFTIRQQFIDDVTETSLLQRLAKLEKPLLIFHSLADDIVGIDHAKVIFNCANDPKSFVALDGADHLLTNPADTEFVAHALAAWTCRYLDDDGANSCGVTATDVRAKAPALGGIKQLA